MKYKTVFSGQFKQILPLLHLLIINIIISISIVQWKWIFIPLLILFFEEYII